MTESCNAETIVAPELLSRRLVPAASAVEGRPRNIIAAIQDVVLKTRGLRGEL